MSAPLVDVMQAAQRFRQGDAVLLDVREPNELKIVAVEGALHIPMRQVPGRAAELPKDKPVLVMCHHGGRSQMVADWLIAQGYQAENVAGGIDAWATDVEPNLPKY